ncbi:DnaJ domain-containing protein [Marinobacter sp.]|uniref:DnaJ domain-containing protein n=1 Tax=Marinobacter sp. TaxID=50741 RepID=UPI00356B3414
MSGRDPQHLQPRTQALLEELVSDFIACRHRPSELISRHRVGRGARNALFYCLGYLAKADGRVTEDDIRFAEHLMTGLALPPRQRSKAIRRFHQGRDSAELSALKLTGFRLLGPWPQHTSLLIGLCVCHGAQLFGAPGKPRRYRCEDAFYQLGLPLAAMDRIFRLYRQEVWISAPPPKPETLQDAYHILGVQAGDSFAHIKRRYRREVSRYHPDKLSDELTSAERTHARDQLLRLQQAWEVIKRRERLTR